MQTAVYTGGTSLSRPEGHIIGSGGRSLLSFGEAPSGHPAEYSDVVPSPPPGGHVSDLIRVARIGPHCKLHSFASMVARARHLGPDPIELRRCACWTCGCRYGTPASQPVCGTCTAGLHCTNAGAIPAESAVSVNSALAWGLWRTWSEPTCGRCLEPLPAGAVARIYFDGDRPPLTAHRTPAECVAAVADDPRHLMRVLRRLELWAGAAVRKGEYA